MTLQLLLRTSWAATASANPRQTTKYTLAPSLLPPLHPPLQADFSGFLITWSNIPPYWIWYSVLSYLRYSWGALMVNQVCLAAGVVGIAYTGVGRKQAALAGRQQLSLAAQALRPSAFPTTCGTSLPPPSPPPLGAAV